MTESKDKRDPEQELRNRRRIELAWAGSLLAILFAVAMVFFVDAVRTTFLPFVQTILAGELPKDEQNFILAVVGATSSMLLLFVLVVNSERVKELEKIVEGEDTHEE